MFEVFQFGHQKNKMASGDNGDDKKNKMASGDNGDDKKTLYHYTDPESLEKIKDSGKIKASKKKVPPTMLFLAQGYTLQACVLKSIARKI